MADMTSADNKLIRAPNDMLSHLLNVKTCLLLSCLFLHINSMVGYASLVFIALTLCRSTLSTKCGTPGWPANGVHFNHNDSYEVGQSISYTCKPAFSPIGLKTATCLEDGSWSSPPILCAKDLLRGNGFQMITSNSEERNYDVSNGLEMDPLLLTDGNANSCVSIRHNSTALFAQLGNRVNVSVIRLVLRDQQQLRKMHIFVDNQICLGNPLPGGGIVELRCSGQLVGSHIEIKIFQFPLEICEIQAYSTKVKCGIPASPLDGYIRTEMADEFRFFCNENYQLVGSPSTRCVNGIWSDDTPKCVEVEFNKSCAALPAVENGDIEYDAWSVDGQFAYSTSAEYFCWEGFQNEGDQIRYCTDRGTWTGVNSSCKPIDCGPFADPSARLINGTGYGAIVEHQCNQSDQIWYSQCTENGWYSGQSDEDCPKSSSAIVGWISVTLISIILTTVFAVIYFKFRTFRYSKPEDSVALELDSISINE